MAVISYFIFERIIKNSLCLNDLILEWPPSFSWLQLVLLQSDIL